jgi:hypothetical protein
MISTPQKINLKKENAASCNWLAKIANAVISASHFKNVRENYKVVLQIMLIFGERTM